MTSRTERAAGSRSKTHWMSSRVRLNMASALIAKESASNMAFPSKIINYSQGSSIACVRRLHGRKPVKTFLRKYVEFFRQPDVARLLTVALIARMPIGMVGFSMLMFLRETLGNYTLAGSAVGIF